MINIRISEVKMQKSGTKHSAITSRRKVMSSTTLNRRYVKRPTRARTTDIAVPVKRSSRLKHFNTPISTTKQGLAPQANSTKVNPHPIQKTVETRMRQRASSTAEPQISKISAKELKDRAIKKALASAATIKTEEEIQVKKTTKMRFGMGRVILALSCAAAAVFAIVYFVNLNMPDISLRVAAMQTGIDATYPGYVPKNYALSGITSENNRITLSFKNSTSDETFSLIEEKSSWDSNALLSNYVKVTFKENYTTIREQGITIFISGGDAAWVNGGIVYKISAEKNTLTNRQISSIATSL